MEGKKPRLSFWQIWNMSFGFLGIQFGFALQNANVSRIFETLGAPIENIPILWLAAPVTGLIVQPIIGHLSDKTWGRLGRRRPYFLSGAIVASLALLVMPNSPVLWIAAGMLWILDASINISMEPFRAFVADMLPSEQRTAGFAMQSFFIGTGAVIASALPYILTNWLNIPNTAPEGHIPLSVKYSFYIGGTVFILSVLWTVLSSKEYPPEELEAYAREEHPDIETAAGREHYKDPDKSLVWGAGLLAAGLLLSYLVYRMDWDQALYVLTGGIAAFGLIRIVAAWFLKNRKINGLVEVVNDLISMPKTMVQLAVVQFFSWFALFAMWIYTTAAVTSHIYGTTDPSTPQYNTGANWVGILFAAYNGFAALVAFLLPMLARYTSRKFVHMVCLIAGGMGLASFYLIHNPDLLLVSMVGIGIAWASILSMPYAILSGSLPFRKMGVYMGIFNFFIVIPQIVAASLLGFFMRSLLHDQAVLALVLGGTSMILAGILVLFVDDADQPLKA